MNLYVIESAGGAKGGIEGCVVITLPSTCDKMTTGTPWEEPSKVSIKPYRRLTENRCEHRSVNTDGARTGSHPCHPCIRVPHPLAAHFVLDVALISARSASRFDPCEQAAVIGNEHRHENRHEPQAEEHTAARRTWPRLFRSAGTAVGHTASGPPYHQPHTSVELHPELQLLPRLS